MALSMRVATIVWRLLVTLINIATYMGLNLIELEGCSLSATTLIKVDVSADSWHAII